MSLSKCAQCGQVAEPYSMTGTPVADPIDNSGRGPGASAFAMSTVPSGLGAVWANADSRMATLGSAAAARRMLAPRQGRRDRQVHDQSAPGVQMRGATLAFFDW